VVYWLVGDTMKVVTKKYDYASRGKEGICMNE